MLADFYPLPPAADLNPSTKLSENINKFIQVVKKAAGKRLSGLVQQLLVYNKVWDFLKL